MQLINILLKQIIEKRSEIVKTKLNLFGVLLDLVFCLVVLFLFGVVVARLWEGIAVEVFGLRPISNLTGMHFGLFLVMIRVWFSIINLLFQIGLVEYQASEALKGLKQALEKMNEESVGEDVNSGKR